jgi:hypothetical protein
MERRPASTSRTRTDVDIGGRQNLAGSTQADSTQRQPRPSDGPSAQRNRKVQPVQPISGETVKAMGLDAAVLDDFPESIRVFQAELDVIETYLGALLDEVLGQPE